MNKPSQFVFLPTKTSYIFGNDDGTATLHKELVTGDGIGSPLEIYILSDDKIKIGDNIACIVNGEIANRTRQNKVGTIGKCVFENGNDGSVWKKIIATTNPELWNKFIMDASVIGGKRYEQVIPSISQSDIEYIISKYNGKGKEVDVEKLLEDEINRINGNIPKDCLDQNVIHWFKKGGRFGYNQSLQDNADKKFTLSQIQDAMLHSAYKARGMRNSLPIVKMIKDYTDNLTKEQPNNTVMVEYDGNIHDEVYRGIKPKLKDGCIIIVRN